MKVLIVRMTHGGWEHASVGSAVALWQSVADRMPEVEDVMHVALDVCPTPVARNRAVELARQNHCDVLISIDADTCPHHDFFRAALEELAKAERPSVIVAPYVCAGDLHRVQVFRWSTNEDVAGNDHLARFAHVSRDEAARLQGREEVACAGTGCYAAHVKAFDRIAPPYFDYEYGEASRVTVVSTEDVRCFRDLSLAGVPIVCLWSHWATHYKTMALGRPAVLTVGDVAERTARLLRDDKLLPPVSIPRPVVDPPAGMHDGNGHGRAKKARARR